MFNTPYTQVINRPMVFNTPRIASPRPQNVRPHPNPAPNPNPYPDHSSHDTLLGLLPLFLHLHLLGKTLPPTTPQDSRKFTPSPYRLPENPSLNVPSLGWPTVKPCKIARPSAQLLTTTTNLAEAQEKDKRKQQTTTTKKEGVGSNRK